MSDIPAARESISLVLKAMRAGKVRPIHTLMLAEALEMMTREPLSRRRAPVKSKVVDDATLRDAAINNPDRSLHDIAAEYGTNPGRVSDALRRLP